MEWIEKREALLCGPFARPAIHLQKDAEALVIGLLLFCADACDLFGTLKTLACGSVLLLLVASVNKPPERRKELRLRTHRFQTSLERDLHNTQSRERDGVSLSRVPLQ
jgi:hypothetical protein